MITAQGTDDATSAYDGRLFPLTNALQHFGVETNGIAPISKEEQVDTRIYQLFTMWLSTNTSITNFVFGASGPVVFKLSFRNTMIIVLIVTLLVCIIPAYLQCDFWSQTRDENDGASVSSPSLKIHPSQQPHRRFSWGAYGVAIPSLLNVGTTALYLFLTTVVGGQMLARVFNNLSPDVGIIIVSVISLVVSFCGSRVLHWFEAFAWIPTAIGICAMLGVGGPYLTSADPYPAPSLASILSFSATVAAGQITWCTFTADYGVYHDANASSARIFTYTYLGIFLPSVILPIIGAAFAAAAPNVPSWAAGFDNGNDIGGLVSAVLAPAGGFGRFLIVLMALGTSAPNATNMYTFGLSLMNVSTTCVKVPRYVFAMIATGICIPLAIVGRTRFYGVLIACLDFVGYWTALFAGIILTEHVLFRRCSWDNYNVEDWDQPENLPPGYAAVGCFLASFALIIPCMAQNFYVGPIGKAIGDVGILVGIISSCFLYWGFRTLEIRMSGR
ncbi:hypothetical protein MSAN_00290900 [Mycena sanguinolenta]|uniref:Purine-cytosine permease n=1 Tax=Mycena sanguinolenta TaxID=230812 RepID=A0A8H7DJ23_9AGAR|nr:hypothetical protein MSAN_00290900 [Mycena sanguinolenta]